MLSGVFNRLLRPASPSIHSLDPISIVTWNARALLHKDSKIRQKKVNYLYTNCSNCTYIFIQEAHGDQALLEDALHLLLRSHWCFTNFCEGRGSTLTLVSKTAVPDPSSVVNLCVVPGRVTRTLIVGRDSYFAIWNFHNFGFQSDDLCKIESLFLPDVARAKADPQNFALCALGDFNFSRPDFDRMSYAQPIASRGSGPRPFHNYSPGERFLCKMFEDLVEMEQPRPTHYSHVHNTGSCIDRVLLSFPPWAFPNTFCTFEPLEDPAVLFADGISDHAPSRLCISSKTPTDPHLRPISKEHCKHPLFHAICSSYLQRIPMEELHPFTRCETHKLVIRIAASKVRNYTLRGHPDSIKCKHQTFVSIARAVWLQNRRLAQSLINHSELAALHLFINVDIVTLKDPDMFTQEFEKIKTSLFAERRDEISCMPEDSITKARKKKSKGNALNRLAKLWTPFSKSVILQGVRDEHGKVVRDPAQLFSCLASAWSKTFNSKPFDSVQAQAFLENHCPAYSHNATPPTPQHFVTLLDTSCTAPLDLMGFLIVDGHLQMVLVL